MFIILHNNKKYKTSKAKSDADALFKFRSFYFKLVNSIDFSDIECDCGSHCWKTHGYYSRYCTFLKRRIRVKIVRLICGVCGKTHALLIDDMIPYSTLSYEEIISNMNDDYTIDDSHHQYLINKYKKCTEYKVMCLLNIRKYSVSFITT